MDTMREIVLAIMDRDNQEFYRLYPDVSEYKNNLFEVACEFGNLDAARHLYEQGALLNGASNMSPFMLALKSRNYIMIDWMLSLPDVNPNVEMDCEGSYNSLAFAIENNFPLDMIDAMVRRGASLNEEYGDFNPLSMAAHVNNMEVFQLLLLHGADPAFVDSDGQSVASYANDELARAIQLWTPRASLLMREIVLNRPEEIYNANLMFSVVEHDVRMNRRPRYT